MFKDAGLRRETCAPDPKAERPGRPDGATAEKPVPSSDNPAFGSLSRFRAESHPPHLSRASHTGTPTLASGNFASEKTVAILPGRSIRPSNKRSCAPKPVSHSQPATNGWILVQIARPLLCNGLVPLS